MFFPNEQTPPYGAFPHPDPRMTGLPQSDQRSFPGPDGLQPYEAMNPELSPFPYPYTGGTDALETADVIDWAEPEQPGVRQQQQPQFFPGGMLDRRLRQIERNQEQFDRRLQRLERNQDQFDRRLQRLERRVAVIERRLGFPVSPGGSPG